MAMLFVQETITAMLCLQDHNFKLEWKKNAKTFRNNSKYLILNKFLCENTVKFRYLEWLIVLRLIQINDLFAEEPPFLKKPPVIWIAIILFEREWIRKQLLAVCNWLYKASYERPSAFLFLKGLHTCMSRSIKSQSLSPLPCPWIIVAEILRVYISNNWTHLA